MKVKKYIVIVSIIFVIICSICFIIINTTKQRDDIENMEILEETINDTENNKDEEITTLNNSEHTDNNTENEEDISITTNIDEGYGVVVDIDPTEDTWFKKILTFIDMQYNNTGILTEETVLNNVKTIKAYKSYKGTTDIYIIFNNDIIDNVVMSQFEENTIPNYTYMKNIKLHTYKKIVGEQQSIDFDKETIQKYINAMINSYYISDIPLSKEQLNVAIDTEMYDNSYFVSKLKLPVRRAVRNSENVLEIDSCLNSLYWEIESREISFKNIIKIDIYYAEESQIAVLKCYTDDGYILLYNDYMLGENNPIIYNMLENTNIDYIEKNMEFIGTINEPYNYVDSSDDNPNSKAINNEFMSINDIIKGETINEENNEEDN